MSTATRRENLPMNVREPERPAPDVRQTLRSIGLIRAVAAFAVGTYILAAQPTSMAVVARACAVYWIVDGLVTLRAVRLAEALDLGRLIFLLRGGIAIGASLIVLVMPLGVVFGPWQPGRGLLFIPVAAVMFAAVGCQIGAVGFDVLICRAIRRLASPWSWAIGVALTVLLALVVALLFAGPAVTAGRVAGVAAIVAALSLATIVLTRES